MIDALIQKQDNFEIVRDKIAQILADETASQQNLAGLAGEDPELWAFKVYTERTNPWEAFLNTPKPVDPLPIVNVWYTDSNFDKGRSNSINRLHSVSTYNIDVIASGQSADNFDGHIAGDEAAALNAQRIARLVRNILFSSEYSYLDLRGVVSSVWLQSVTTSQPEQSPQSVQNILAIRMSLNVEFSEFTQQNTRDTLESVNIDIERASDGQVLSEIEINYPI